MIRFLSVLAAFVKRKMTLGAINFSRSQESSANNDTCDLNAGGLE